MRPEGSEKYKLKDLARIKGGKRLPKGKQLIATRNGHPYIRVTDMGSRFIPIDNIMYVPDDIFLSIKNYITNTNDVLLSIVGTIGEVALVDEKLNNASLTENCVKIQPIDDRLNPFYLYYFLISNKGQEEIEKGIVGSTQPKLPLYNIEKIEVPVLSIEEQKSIIELLSSLDDKIELNLQMNKTLEAIAQAIFKEWFIDFRFPGFDGEMVDGLPKGWKRGKLLELFQLQRGYDLPSTIRVGGTYPVVAASGIASYHNEFKVIGPGITTGRSGVIGNVYYIYENFWPLNTSLFIKTFLNSTPIHAYFILKSLNLLNLNGGSAVPTLNRNDVHGLDQIIPPKRILDLFEKIGSTLFDKIFHNITENQTLTQLRNTLLPKLMTGKIRIA